MTSKQCKMKRLAKQRASFRIKQIFKDQDLELAVEIPKLDVVLSHAVDESPTDELGIQPNKTIKQRHTYYKH